MIHKRTLIFYYKKLINQILKLIKLLQFTLYTNYYCKKKNIYIYIIPIYTEKLHSFSCMLYKFHFADSTLIIYKNMREKGKNIT